MSEESGWTSIGCRKSTKTKIEAFKPELDSDSRLLKLLEIAKTPPEVESEGEIVERWLCPFCQNPFSVESRERLVSHFKNTHLLDIDENPALIKLRKVFQVAIATGKITECECLDRSKYPFECLKHFPEKIVKVDSFLKCKACQSQTRQELERRTGIPLAPIPEKVCDCPKLEGLYMCSISHQPCDFKNCSQYYWMKKGEGLNRP